MAFLDFFGFLVATSYSSGSIAAEKKKSKGARAQMPSDRELSLSKDFRDGFMADISLSLGRPYKYEFPRYLELEYENKGWSYEQISKAKSEWKIRSQNGVMHYIARKEGWAYICSFCKTATYSEMILEQEEYMSWYLEAQERFPHYATEHMYIEEYPTKEAYFDGIQKFREEYKEAEECIGFVGESDDPEYDAEIRRLFYSIDPQNQLGGIDMKYVVFKYVRQFDYMEDNWEDVKKFYAALTRIVREEGLDAGDLLRKDGFFSYPIRDEIVETYRTLTPTRAAVEKALAIIEARKADKWQSKEKILLEYRIHMEALRLMLRIDGYDPADYKL